MKKFALFFAAVFFAHSANAFNIYKIDSNHTNITWSVNHFGFSNPSGKFSESSGTLTLNESNPISSNIDITVKIASLQTGFSQLNKELLGANFFNAEKFPEARFVSNNINPQRKSAIVTGDFTFMGVTHPLTLNVKLNKIGINPITQKKTVGFSIAGSFKRSDFGMDFGTPEISDIVKLNIETEAVLETSNVTSYPGSPSTNSSSVKIADKPWQISSESKIEFTAMQGSAVINGSFKKLDGQIIFDPHKPQFSKASIDIDVTSISTSVTDAAATLQNPDWFSFARFPKANFTSTEFIPGLANQYVVRGNLTIKGKTVPVILKLVFDSYSDTSATATGTTIIKRSDFGIGDPDPSKSSNIQDDVKIQFTIKASRS